MHIHCWFLCLLPSSLTFFAFHISTSLLHFLLFSPCISSWIMGSVFAWASSAPGYGFFLCLPALSRYILYFVLPVWALIVTSVNVFSIILLLSSYSCHGVLLFSGGCHLSFPSSECLLFSYSTCPYLFHSAPQTSTGSFLAMPHLLLCPFPLFDILLRRSHLLSHQ